MTQTHSLKKAAQLFVAAFSFSTISFAFAAPEITSFENTHEATLNNGLKVVVREDHRTPVVTAMVWYKVGSVDEPRGLGGVSHMLEHMMFKGTDTLGPNEHSTIIANLGGRDNAFTSTDYTGYFENLPAWELETALKLEADRMQNLELREADFAPERLVVAEERRQRTDSNPQAKLYETFSATMFNTSAYRNPIIGWMPEIHSWQLEDLQKWYEQFYAPNNATVVIVGDVDPTKTIEMVEHYFGNIPSSENITRPYNFEVAQEGEKRVNLAVPANLPVIFMGYKVPSVNEIEEGSMDAAALLLTSIILDGTNSSRLSKSMVRDQQIALQAGSFYSYGARYVTPFTFVGVPSEKNSLEDLEIAFKKEIKNLQTTPVTQAELDRIIGLYEASSIYAKDSVYSQAMLIGQAETTGEGWQNAEKRVELLKKVTPEMIQNVANKYFQDDLLTVATLHPTKQAANLLETSDAVLIDTATE
ncbi:insulinase family protein [Ignatzschineria rhizosphaerae]|uniref:Insulinase family protein n=1 Tax=Ignatzschineria rhizosphaerae TaxID=2923279 RepID=A0ABY3X0N0_9GAMM|nr:pitrilysin family protein [Ignatzschineria rhizosphaerae]UNM96459.1 insulinase family protein [Ignatzschineria rhizosphaerae]